MFRASRRRRRWPCSTTGRAGLAPALLARSADPGAAAPPWRRGVAAGERRARHGGGARRRRTRSRRLCCAPSGGRSRPRRPTAPAGSARRRRQHVCAEFAATTGDAAPALILDGGPCPIGVESTVLDLTGPLPVLLRPGGVTRRGPRRSPRHGRDAAADAGDRRAALARAACRAITRPSLPVRLDATDARPGEALLAFGPEAPPGFAEVLFLSRQRRSRRGGGESVRDAAPSRPAGIFRHRGDADPGAGSRPGDQRPAAPRRRAALRLATSARASPTRRRSRERPAAGG